MLPQSAQIKVLKPKAPGLVPFLAFLLLTCASSVQASSPWELLEAMRNSLREAGPTTATFTQTYIPAGFTSGDQESGHFSIWLPRCLRWNYEEPEGKSFLLCEDEVWFWNIGENVGRHYQIDPGREPGLDLLLVDVAKLRERYTASSARLEDGTFEISLSTGQGADALAAKVRLDPTSDRVLSMEYTDDEGSLTRFDIGDYQALSHTGLFRPPGDLEWTEEE